MALTALEAASHHSGSFNFEEKLVFCQPRKHVTYYVQTIEKLLSARVFVPDSGAAEEMGRKLPCLSPPRQAPWTEAGFSVRTVPRGAIFGRRRFPLSGNTLSGALCRNQIGVSYNQVNNCTPSLVSEIGVEVNSSGRYLAA